MSAPSLLAPASSMMDRTTGSTGAVVSRGGGGSPRQRLFNAHVPVLGFTATTTQEGERDSSHEIDTPTEKKESERQIQRQSYKDRLRKNDTQKQADRQRLE